MIIKMNSLVHFFEEQGMHVQIVEVSPTLKYIVVTYQDIDGKSYPIEMDIQYPKLISAVFDSGDHFGMLQMGFSFPFSPKRSCLEDTLKLIAHFNGTSLFPGLAFDFLNGKINYRLAIPTSAHSYLAAPTLLSLFHSFIQQIQIVEKPIHDVARGLIHYDQLREESELHVAESIFALLPEFRVG